MPTLAARVDPDCVVGDTYTYISVVVGKCELYHVENIV
jgi:hypothetical protein